MEFPEGAPTKTPGDRLVSREYPLLSPFINYLISEFATQSNKDFKGGEAKRFGQGHPVASKGKRCLRNISGSVRGNTKILSP